MAPRFSRNGYRIMHIDGTVAHVCAQFLYKGYVVSFSTILPDSPITIFTTNDQVVKCDLKTVQDAIQFIDTLPVLQ